MSISAMILTFNEEANLPRCLESLKWCDDIVVLDSYSNDLTERIAREAGARFHQHKFDSFAVQRNYGLESLSYKHEWVLLIDADEEVPDELAREMMMQVSSCEPGLCLFKMRRRDFLLGRWIKRSSGYPTWFERLARVGRVKGVQRGHGEEYRTDGQVGYLECCLHHYPFNKGFQPWLEKHNRYSSAEAAVLSASQAPSGRLADLICSDSSRRRQILKSMAYRLPARPLFIFMALFFIRGGILEGRAGVTFCTLRAFYEFMIDCKVRELRRRERRLPV
jgi:glycosyltransferase involved in cell wall biosynthesis